MSSRASVRLAPLASASAQAYWAGGATLGPIIAFARRAAVAVNAEQVHTPEHA